MKAAVIRVTYNINTEHCDMCISMIPVLLWSHHCGWRQLHRISTWTNHYWICVTSFISIKLAVFKLVIFLTVPVDSGKICPLPSTNISSFDDAFSGLHDHISLIKARTTHKELIDQALVPFSHFYFDTYFYLPFRQFFFISIWIIFFKFYIWWKWISITGSLILIWHSFHINNLS